MPMRFIGKNIRKRVVRSMKNSTKFGGITMKSVAPNQEEDVVDEQIEKIEPIKEESTKQAKKNKSKKEKEMIDENKLTKMEGIAGTNLPQTNVKIEKSEKGLYERTENSTILLTEDNKMLLND